MVPRHFNNNRERVLRMEYKTVQLPKHMLELVKEIICSNPELGYASQMSFVQDAVRRRIEQLYTNGNIELQQKRARAGQELNSL